MEMAVHDNSDASIYRGVEGSYKAFHSYYLSIEDFDGWKLTFITNVDPTKLAFSWKQDKKFLYSLCPFYVDYSDKNPVILYFIFCITV